jgi:hypothetical protein
MVNITLLNTNEKLDLVAWQLAAQYKILTDIQETLVTVSSEQADFDADIQTLTTFLGGLPAQLAAIQTALSNQGITDVAPLDALVTEAQGLGPALANLPGGTPPSTPPVTPTS